MIAGSDAAVYSKKKGPSSAACSLKIKLMDMLNLKTQKATCSKLRMRRQRQAKLQPSNAVQRRTVKFQREQGKTMCTNQAVLQMANFTIWA